MVPYLLCEQFFGFVGLGKKSHLPALEISQLSQYYCLLMEFFFLYCYRFIITLVSVPFCFVFVIPCRILGERKGKLVLKRYSEITYLNLMHVVVERKMHKKDGIPKEKSHNFPSKIKEEFEVVIA